MNNETKLKESSCKEHSWIPLEYVARFNEQETKLNNQSYILYKIICTNCGNMKFTKEL